MLLGYCLGLLSTAMVKTMIQSNLGRLYFTYTSRWQFIIEGSKVGSPSMAGTWRQKLKQKLWGMLFAVLFSRLAFLYNTFPGVAPFITDWALTPITNQENVPQTWLETKSDGDILLIECSSYQWPQLVTSW